MKLHNEIFAVGIAFSVVYSLSIGGIVSASPPATSSVGDGSGPIPLSPHEQAISAQSNLLAHDAAVDLDAGNYALAEAEARQSLALSFGSGVSDEVLAEALEKQGKNKEAIEQYHLMVVDRKSDHGRVLLSYAELLLKSGQWAQAVAIYNQVLPSLGDDELEKETRSFSPEVPQPVALETAIHLERGQIYNGTPSWGGKPQDTKAMWEYQKALQLAPDNALTNYYYGVGWRKLAPADRAKFGTAQQAKAALQKAVKIGNADVKKAATKALKEAG